MSKSEPFAQIPQSIWRKAAKARLSGRAWLLLVALYGYADQTTGKAWPGLVALSRETGIEPRDLPRVTKDLSNAGLVSVEVRGALSHGRKCNLYTLTTVQIADGELTDGGNTDGGSAPSTTVQMNGESYQLSDHPSEAIASSGVAPAEGKRSRNGMRLPDDWRPSEIDRQFAISLELNPDEVAAEFCDYWWGVPGAKALKVGPTGWSLTFRNRCRELVSRQKSKAKPQRASTRDVVSRLQFEGRASR